MNTYKANLPRVFDSVISTVGINVMLIVLETARYKIKNKYPEASAIYFSERGIVFDEIEKLPSEKAILIVEGFLTSVIDILGRLIGAKKAEKIASQLKFKVSSASYL